jgi:DNA-binding NarL/FixJ family response regulator
MTITDELGLRASAIPAPSRDVRAHVNTRDAMMRARLVTLLRRAGIALAAQPDRSLETVVIAAGRTIGEAIDMCPPGCRPGRHRLLVVADTFSPDGVRHAIRAGVRAMLPSAEVTPAHLAAALHSARHGEGWIPHHVLLWLLQYPAGAGTTAPAGSRAPARPEDEQCIQALTPRQSTVLRLIADGHSNAMIARTLSCSEHTIKNVIYDLMARLQVTNRAHAVARGIRTGLI